MKKYFRDPFLYLALGLVVFAIVSRWYFMGASLWHDDAFNFVHKALSLAIDHSYTNAHSTGYPFWIAILAGGVSLWHAVTSTWNSIVAPNVVITFFSIILIFPVFVISSRLLANRYYGLLATFLVCINPVMWRWGAVAMSDVFALVFALAAIAFVFQFIHTQKYWMLYASAGMLYIALMTRVVYVVLIPILFVTIWYAKKRLSSKDWLHGALSYGAVVIVVLGTYALLNEGSLEILLADFGYVAPSLSDMLGTIGILFTGVGPLFVPFVIFGGWYLVKRDKVSAFFVLSSVGVFIVYYAGWYTNGFFDIERYGMLIILLATLVAACSLLGPPWLRLSFLATAFLMLFFVHGLVKPVLFYKTYATGDTIFESYYLKYQQVAQQKLIDGDLQTYQDLMTIIKPNDTVVRWGNDWSIPELVFAGPQVNVSPRLIGVNTASDIVEAIASANGRVYLLRGAFEEAQRAIANGDLDATIQTESINDRSVVHYIIQP